MHNSALSNDQFAAILAALPDPVFILTRSGRYAAVFGGADLRYYHDGSGLVGLSIGDVLTREKTDFFLGEIASALHGGGLHIVEYTLAGSDVKGLKAEGPSQPIWFEGRVQRLAFQVAGEDAVLWVASNITPRHELETRLRAQSETDPLTGLANRRKLLAAMQQHFALFSRYRTPSAILAFDIDHLKHINDRHGHLMGDQVIIALAGVCRAELRGNDVPARFGGDEFVALLPQTGLPSATVIAQRLRQQALHAFAALGIGDAAATISIGISEFAADDASCESALERADNALYRAKAQGRNQVVS
ncbi:GGDEF domain-containing protein [Vogesella facilis]|uniref:diguanylate cyclase n=1 Tax=Vogesella facilis TaxID=1655232 RepID=A0ABV7RFA0_9NEIS